MPARILENDALSTYHEVLDRPEHNTLFPSMKLGMALRNLTGPQQIALEALLEEFHKHPRTKSAGQYLAESFNTMRQAGLA